MPVVELPPTTTVSHEVVVPGATGSDPTVRVYSPPTEGSGRPCIYWIHGGGYLFGSGPQRRRPHQPLGRGVRLRRGVDRVPPRARSTRTRRRSTTATRASLWTAQHADELGIDPARIAIAGASAGGGLAAGLAILARDRGEVAPSFQLLDLSDDRRHATRRRRATSRARSVWSRAANDLGWSALPGRARSAPTTSPRDAAPARVDDVAGLPPAWIGVGSLDVFRDEDITYASRLLAAGITTELHVYPGAPHGFEMIVADRGRRAGVSARHHGSAAAGAASDVRRRVHQLTAKRQARSPPAPSPPPTRTSTRRSGASGGSTVVSSASTSRSAA